MPKAVLCFSSVYYNLTDANQQRTQSTAQSSATVLAPNEQSVITYVHLDTGGERILKEYGFVHYTLVTILVWLDGCLVFPYNIVVVLFYSHACIIDSMVDMVVHLS